MLFFHLKFTTLMIFQEEELKGSILVVLANKQDIEGAMSVTEVSSNLVLPKFISLNGSIFVQGCFYHSGPQNCKMVSYDFENPV